MQSAMYDSHPTHGIDSALDAAQITVLDSTPFAWLHEMLEVFNAGDLHAYDALCEKHADELNGQPALVEHERALREKITILCLTELIFGCERDRASAWPRIYQHSTGSFARATDCSATGQRLNTCASPC